ncbi:MAG: hypothetical protein RLZZ511_4357 [Cyanobacteriota bacterium]
MADDEELAEGTNVRDRGSQLDAARAIHVGGRLVEEGNVNVGEDFEQREADGEGGAHLLTTGKVDEATGIGSFTDDNFIVARPFEGDVGAIQQFAEEFVSFTGDALNVEFGDAWPGLLVGFAGKFDEAIALLLLLDGSLGGFALLLDGGELFDLLGDRGETLLLLRDLGLAGDGFAVGGLVVGLELAQGGGIEGLAQGIAGDRQLCEAFAPCGELGFGFGHFLIQRFEPIGGGLVFEIAVVVGAVIVAAGLLGLDLGREVGKFGELAFKISHFGVGIAEGQLQLAFLLRELGGTIEFRLEKALAATGVIEAGELLIEVLQLRLILGFAGEVLLGLLDLGFDFHDFGEDLGLFRLLGFEGEVLGLLLAQGNEFLLSLLK